MLHVVTVADYHYLDREDISRLLSRAKHATAIQDVAAIQVRLTQGIHGMTCPRPNDGVVALRSVALDVLFVTLVRDHGDEPWCVELFAALMGLPGSPARRILTAHDYPPIGVTTRDWSAWKEGREETGPYGHGRSEAEAVTDLREQLEGQ